MQSAEQVTKATEKEELEENLKENLEREPAGVSTKEKGEEIKSRSRFSSAFRSLSKPKAKKDKERSERDKSKEKGYKSSDGFEDLASAESSAADQTKEKKKSLTRRLLLGGLRKSAKVRPHSLATSDDISLGTGGTLSPTPSTSSSTLQITISGKKIEPVGKSHSKNQSRSSAASETETAGDYLTPEAIAEEGTKVGGSSAKQLKKKKTTSNNTSTKVTTKDTTNTTTTTTSTTKLIVAKKRQPLSATASEEKIVITESTRDTPPRERAPAKPSRVSQTQSPVQSSIGTGAVRKSSGSSSKSSKSSKKLELMQQQQQRGHRLILTRPATLTVANPVTPDQALEPLAPSYPPPPLPLPSLEEQAGDNDNGDSRADGDGKGIGVGDGDGDGDGDGISSAESVQTHHQSIPVVRFAVGSAVRSPLSAYEEALAAAAKEQPSSVEDPSESSIRRRLTFAQQQQHLILGDHDSIEGRRETLRYQSVASEYSNRGSGSSEESAEDKEEQQQQSMPAFGDLTMEMEPAIMTTTSEKREHLYKILVIGELGTGKTSFIKRYVHQFFSQNYRATIGVDFALKVLHWDANTIVRLQLWDIAGQERFGNMTRVYYKEAVGAFIVFDVTRSGTFDCVSKWKEDLDSKVQLPDGSAIPCILLANKCDQEKQGIVTQPERMDEYVKENGFAGWFETSAKENINIDEAARALVNKILINDKLITADLADGDKFNLNSSNEPNGQEAKNKCSC